MPPIQLTGCIAPSSSAPQTSAMTRYFSGEVARLWTGRSI